MDTAGSQPVDVPDSPCPAVVELMSTPADEPEVLGNGMQSSSGPALVITSQGFLQLFPEPVNLPPRADVALSSMAGSVSESSPVVTTDSALKSQSNVVPVSFATSWADLVDHVKVPNDPPAATPVAKAKLRYCYPSRNLSF